MLFAGVAVLAAVAVGIAGEAMRPKSPGRRVLTDAGYVKLANAECARTLPDLRPPAWVFLHGLKSPLSSTALRAVRQVANAKSQKGH